MDAFNWSQQFETGLPMVDEQHHRLVDLINEFGSLVTQSANVRPEEVERVFSELAAYAEFHFSEEESMMVEVGLKPDYIAYHQRQHADFLQEVTRIHARLYSVNDQQGPHRLLMFLIHWLAYHILGIDQAMARQVADVQRGIDPEKAAQTSRRRSTDNAVEPLLKALRGLLHEVSERNLELMTLNQSLEAKVAERTQALQEANEALEHLALTDALTGLPNRRSALARLASEWQDALARKKPLTCLMMDADKFKDVNDDHGHDAGDEVLRRLAWKLRESVRTNDLVCRMGGDEFMVILPDTPAEGAQTVAEHIRAAVAGLSVPLGNATWQGSISIGGATSDPAMNDCSALIKAADAALYVAKRSGRNRTHLTGNTSKETEAVVETDEPKTITPAVNVVLDAITGASSLNERLKRLHLHLLETVPTVDRVACALYDAKEDMLRTFINSTRKGETIAGYEFKLSKSRSLSQLAESGEFRVLDDIPKLIASTSEHSQWLLEQGYRSSFTAPLYHNGLFIGLVFYDSTEPSAFTPIVQRDLVHNSNLINTTLSGEIAVVHSMLSSTRLARDFANMRDFETGAHLDRMARYARIIAKALAPLYELSDEFVEHVGLFAPLHDIGKIGIPDHILLKPGKLDVEERKIIESHVEKGGEIIDRIIHDFGLYEMPQLDLLRNIVLCHHEYLDGSGYPHGLKGNEIPLEARIITVADIFDALSCLRPYKQRWSAENALNELQSMVDAGQLDATCVAALEQNMDRIKEITTRFSDEPS